MTCSSSKSIMQIYGAWVASGLTIQLEGCMTGTRLCSSDGGAQQTGRKGPHMVLARGIIEKGDSAGVPGVVVGPEDLHATAHQRLGRHAGYHIQPAHHQPWLAPQLHGTRMLESASSLSVPMTEWHQALIVPAWMRAAQSCTLCVQDDRRGTGQSQKSQRFWNVQQKLCRCLSSSMSACPGTDT